MYTTYKLSDDDSGLNCTANGLAYGGLKLVEKSAVTGRFEPCNLPLLQKSGIVIPSGRLQAIANALNENNTSLAIIAALHLMPSLGFMVKAGYRDDEPRDEQGKWTTGGGDGVKSTDNISTAADSDNTQSNGITLVDDKLVPDQKKQLIDTLFDSANKAATQLHVPVENVLGAAAIESGWGTSDFATGGNNYFGLHYPAPYATGSTPARKDPKIKVATFAHPEDSAKSFAEEMKPFAFGKGNPKDFAIALQDSGKFGINPDGSKRASYVPNTSATIIKLHEVVSILLPKL